MSKRQVKKWRALAEQERNIVETLQKALDKSIDDYLFLQEKCNLQLEDIQRLQKEFEEQRSLASKTQAEKEFLELTLKENCGTISSLQTLLEIEHRAGIEREGELLALQDKLTQIATFSMGPKTMEPEVMQVPVPIPDNYTPSKDGDPI